MWWWILGGYIKVMVVKVIGVWLRVKCVGCVLFRGGFVLEFYGCGCFFVVW